MVPRPDSGLIVLCGSETRARIVGVLANAFGPMTGYRVGRTAGVGLPKAYAELRKLKEGGLARETSNGWILTDSDIGTLFRKRYRLSWSGDWFDGVDRRARSDEEILSRLAELPPPQFPKGWVPRRAALSRRSRSKDEVLAELGLRGSLHADP